MRFFIFWEEKIEEKNPNLRFGLFRKMTIFFKRFTKTMHVLILYDLLTFKLIPSTRWLVSLLIGWMTCWLVDDMVNGFLRCQGCCIVALLIGVMGGNVFQRSLKKKPSFKDAKNKIWNNYSLLLKKKSLNSNFNMKKHSIVGYSWYLLIL